MFALARVPIWGEDQLDGLSRIGVVPTFEKDYDRLVEGPTEVSLGFDVETHAEAQGAPAIGRWERGAHYLSDRTPSTAARRRWPYIRTAARTSGLVMFAQEARLLPQTAVASTP